MQGTRGHQKKLKILYTVETTNRILGKTFIISHLAASEHLI